MLDQPCLLYVDLSTPSATRYPGKFFSDNGQGGLGDGFEQYEELFGHAEQCQLMHPRSSRVSGSGENQLTRPKVSQQLRPNCPGAPRVSSLRNH
jgi:hypothetical protein